VWSKEWGVWKMEARSINSLLIFFKNKIKNILNNLEIFLNILLILVLSSYNHASVGTYNRGHKISSVFGEVVFYDH
jgi:hypothetical protein